MYTELALFIDGKWLTGEGRLVVQPDGV